MNIYNTPSCLCICSSYLLVSAASTGGGGSLCWNRFERVLHQLPKCYPILPLAYRITFLGAEEHWSSSTPSNWSNQPSDAFFVWDSLWGHRQQTQCRKKELLFHNQRPSLIVHRPSGKSLASDTNGAHQGLPHCIYKELHCRVKITFEKRTVEKSQMWRRECLRHCINSFIVNCVVKNVARPWPQQTHVR